MVSFRHKNLILIACIVLSVWLLIAQAYGSSVLLLPCLVSFLALMAWSAIQGMVMPVLLFFLPFSPLLKISQGSISFYTIGLMCVYLIYLVLGSKNIDIRHFIPAFCLVALTMVVKVFNGSSFENSYFLFIATLLVLPFLKREIDDKYDLYELTFYFVFGIVLAATTSRFLISNANITEFIATFDIHGSIRYAGFYGDPNFYSAHITAALSGVLLLLLELNTFKRMVSLVLMAATLLYCGLLSVSKSFFLIVVCLLLLWIARLLFQKGKVSFKLTVVFLSFIAVIFLLCSTVFADALDLLVARFGSDNTISDFTTKRTNIWINYFNHFEEHPIVLFFGNGYSNSAMVYGRAAHNTIIQLIFQFGIVGFLFLATWFVYFVKSFVNSFTIQLQSFLSLSIVLIGSIGPWLALDMLFSDEFFIIPIYVFVGLNFLNKNSTNLSYAQARI